MLYSGQWALRDTDIDKLSKLMDLQERWEAKEAKKLYVTALAQFSADLPAIVKTRKGHNSKYAGLAETLTAIRPAMDDYGLSHSWKTSQEGGQITVACILTHAAGHSEETSLSSGSDKSGSKNDIQAIGSTVSYLERYTLYAILGLASADDDGKASEPVEKITDDQALELEAMITDNDIDIKRVKAWMKQTLKVDTFADINVNAFDGVKNKIEATIKAQS